MKALLMIALLVSGSVQAASITAARYDASTDELVMEINYGGCNEDSFQLNYGPCAESFPAQITLTLDDSKDMCEALAHTTIRRDISDLSCRPSRAALRTRFSNKGPVVFIPKN